MKNPDLIRRHPRGEATPNLNSGDPVKTAAKLPAYRSRLFKHAAHANGMTFLLCLVLMFVPYHAHAARFSGDYLLQVCAIDENGEELVEGGHIACQSYISGVLDYHNLIRSLGTAPSVDFCVPEGTTIKQIHMDVARYIAQNKHEQGPFIAAPGVALALFATYPCP